METIIENIQKITLKDNGKFPNNFLPALLYKGVLYIPSLFPARNVKNLFESNRWSNSWDSGIFTYNHYHSNTHEVLGIYKGETTLLLGGDNGVRIKIEQGDVLVIPAGVAHKNLGEVHDVACVGAYPNGVDYDVNYGNNGERPHTDRKIREALLPEADPVYGKGHGLCQIWDDGCRHIL